MVVIRLSPAGRKKAHVYKVIVAEKGAKLTGKYIEKLGTYTPGRSADGRDAMTVNKDRYEHWVKMGAIPSPTLTKLITFHQLPEAEQKTRFEADKAARKKRVAAKAKKAESAEAPAAQ